MRASHLRWKASSPTASTSSMSSTSASRCAAIEKPRRRNMPDEYVATGASMKSPSSENAMIASRRSSICSLTRPCSAPLRKMFSRPEKSRPKPAPSSSWATTWPPQATRPEFSGTIPDSTRSVEDLPAPLRPTMPTVSPGSMRSETSRSACTGAGPPARLRPMSISFSVRPRSALTLNAREACSSTISPGRTPSSSAGRRLTRPPPARPACDRTATCRRAASRPRRPRRRRARRSPGRRRRR